MAMSQKSLAALKRRIRVGTKLLCVRNTYRPVLDGTERTVVKVQTVSFAWKQPDSDKPSWTPYPKASGLTWIDDSTFRLDLELKEGHYVELRILEDGPVVEKPVRAKKESFDRMDTEKVFHYARQKAKYGHRTWIVWDDKKDGRCVARLSQEVLEKAMADVGPDGVISSYGSDGTGQNVRRALAEVWLSNMQAGTFIFG
jgi:hypothetical protein